ncbi:type II secretion system protein M [Marinomonas sp. 15G1-11]|uniref:Type II secretion system protein M n=1 Tax=Marinomonas phaeophyticola TaxID=3004091 RepID=A0ABT4JTA2_9GAMM|nr:type II secretion system protein M [Marinomonas sp. 15G1-11]MCZ2721543.1 type II secretion system protein M [Marinomonas sp. 15G1-11]
MKSWLMNQFRSSPSLYSIWLAYLRLSIREQVLVFVLAAFVCLLSVYFLLWKPMQLQNQAAQVSFERSLADYYKIIENANHLRAFKGESTSGLIDRSANELRALVNSTARQHGIVAERIAVEGDSRLQVWVSNTDFAKLSPWITALGNAKTKIYAMQWRSQEVGEVDLKITLD